MIKNPTRKSCRFTMIFIVGFLLFCMQFFTPKTRKNQTDFFGKNRLIFYQNFKQNFSLKKYTGKAFSVFQAKLVFVDKSTIQALHPANIFSIF